MINAEFRRRYGLRQRTYRPVGNSYAPKRKPMSRTKSNVGTCNKCNATIYWVKTERGKSVALNDDQGQHQDACFDDSGAFHPRGGYGRTSHFGTCPGMQDAHHDQREPSDRQRQWETVSKGMAQTWTLEEMRDQVSNLSRLVGIIERAGGDPVAVKKTREAFQACIRRGFAQ